MHVTNQLFVKRSQYIRVENPLHKQSEKAYMCFKTRRASIRDYTVYYKKEHFLSFLLFSQTGIFLVFFGQSWTKMIAKGTN